MTEIDKLHFLAKEFDPFSPISERSLDYLKELKLDQFIHDPYHLTNEVLKRLHEFDTLDKPTLQ